MSPYASPGPGGASPPSTTGRTSAQKRFRGLKKKHSQGWMNTFYGAGRPPADWSGTLGGWNKWQSALSGNPMDVNYPKGGVNFAPGYGGANSMYDYAQAMGNSIGPAALAWMKNPNQNSAFHDQYDAWKLQQLQASGWFDPGAAARRAAARTVVPAPVSAPTPTPTLPSSPADILAQFTMPSISATPTIPMTTPVARSRIRRRAPIGPMSQPYTDTGGGWY